VSVQRRSIFLAITLEITGAVCHDTIESAAELLLNFLHFIVFIHDPDHGHGVAGLQVAEQSFGAQMDTSGDVNNEINAAALPAPSLQHPANSRFRATCHMSCHEGVVR